MPFVAGWPDCWRDMLVDVVFLAVAGALHPQSRIQKGLERTFLVGRSTLSCLPTCAREGTCAYPHLGLGAGPLCINGGAPLESYV